MYCMQSICKMGVLADKKSFNWGRLYCDRTLARIDQLENGRYAIRRSATLAKDQTYALYNLTQEQLKRTLMPVGQYSKDEIRKIAEKIGLLVANKPDSQDICFVPDGDYAALYRRKCRCKNSGR